MDAQSGLFPPFIVLLLAIAAVTSGCMGTAPPAGTPVDTTKPILPPGPPEPAVDTNATVLAAILNQTGGGIVFFQSGVSGIIVFSDGTVLSLHGMPWGPRDRFGSCSAQVQGVLAKAAAWLKSNGTIECGRDMVAASRLARMDPESATHLATYLARHQNLTVAAERQQPHGADMAETGHHVWANGKEAFYLDQPDPSAPTGTTTSEGATMDTSDSGSVDVDAVVAQLDLLAAWLQDG